MTTEASVLDAVKEDGRNLRFLAQKQKNDRDIVLAAVEQNGYALEYASATLRNNRDVVLAAVQQNGRSLQFASETLRNDRDVVLGAVEQNGRALQFASETLRNDRDIVLAAVQQHGYALEYASSGLNADRAVVLAAMRKAPRMFLFAITTRGEYDEQSLLFRDRSLWLEWCRSGPSECKELTPPMDPHLWSEIFAAAKSRLASRDSDQQLVCNITDIAFEPLLTPLVAGGASESPSIRIHTVYCLNGQQEVWLGLSPETTVAQFADLVLRRKFPTTPLIYLRLLFKDAPLSVWAGEELLTSLLTPLQGTASEQQREHACLEIRAAPKT